MAKRTLTPRMVSARENESQAFELRKQGYSYRAIGEMLGMTDMGAIKAIRRVLERINSHLAENIDEVRRLELERLDGLIKGHYERAENGDTRSAEIVLKAQERRAKLLGLDAPKNLKIDGPLAVRVYTGVDLDAV